MAKSQSVFHGILVACSLSVVFALTPPAFGKTKPPKRPEAPAKPAAPFSVIEANIPEMRAAMESGRITSRGLVIE